MDRDPAATELSSAGPHAAADRQTGIALLAAADSPSGAATATAAAVSDSASAARPGFDSAARRALLAGTGGAAVLGGVAGVAHSVVSGYPLPRSVLRVASSTAAVAFTYLGSSLLLSERCSLPASSLSNALLAGCLTFGSLLSLQAAGDGRIATRADARRVGLRGAALGALLGGAAWAAQRTAAWWHSAADGSRAGDASKRGGASWLPAWSPIRVATEEDLARADKQKADRERRALQLQEQHWQRAQQQQQQQQQAADGE